MDEKNDLKRCTEALIYSAQEQSKWANYIKCNIDKTGKLPHCRMCGTRNKNISHVVNVANLPKRSTNGGIIV